MLTQEERQAIQGYFYAAVFWLLVPGVAGLVMAALLYSPPLQKLIPLPLRAYLNFGRLRPMHVNALIFGWLSMVYAGSMLYITRRLTGAPLFSPRLARITWWLWNLLIVGAAVTLLMGMNQGREYAEMIWPLDLLFLLIIVLLGVNIWGTVARRQEPKLYVSVWNFMAATMILIPVYAVGNKIWDPSGAYTGMNDNIINYFYVHNLFNAWFTTGGIGLAFYLLPRLTGNPLHSHGLAMWGLWSVWTGQHHQLWSPAPDWLEILTVVFSILAIVPTTAFMWNFYKTMQGRWARVGQDVALRFFVVGAIFWGFTCIQGEAQSIRSFSLYVHFTNWVVSHSHLAFVGDYSLWAFALVYLIIPELVGRPIYSRRLAEWHFWLTLVGLTAFMTSLWLAGVVQGQQWMTGGIPFIESVRAMHPYFAVRLVAGLTMGVGQLIFAYNVWQTAVQRVPVHEAWAPIGARVSLQ
ncbi:MAG: cbb3-type cytochrome c oxidase subunit I [Anaerolineae bacterium]